MSETILTNARLILEDEVVEGTIVFGPEGIRRSIRAAASCPAPKMPAVIMSRRVWWEMHTDNMEKHFMPRRKCSGRTGLPPLWCMMPRWQAAGVTTVYDAVLRGTPFPPKIYRKDIFRDVMAALAKGRELGVFRIDHHIHMRCELTSPDLLADIEPYADNPLVRLVSLMDHNARQRQWRNIEHLRTYAIGSGKSAAEFETDLVERAKEAQNVPTNWAAVVEMFRQRGVPIATHDDTTIDHVEAGIASAR